MEALGYATDRPLAELWHICRQPAYCDGFDFTFYDGKLWTVQHRASGLFVRDTLSVDIYHGHGKLNLYRDHSGPSLEVYVGDDWQRDKGWWTTTCHVNHKLNHEPRRSLTYSGRGRCTMDHSDDLGRAYSPIHGKAPIAWLWAMTTPEYRKSAPMDADAPRSMSLAAVIAYFAKQVQAVVDQVRKTGGE